jgi:hypothetical protein
MFPEFITYFLSFHKDGRVVLEIFANESQALMSQLNRGIKRVWNGGRDRRLVLRDSKDRFRQTGSRRLLSHHKTRTKRRGYQGVESCPKKIASESRHRKYTPLLPKLPALYVLPALLPA